MEPVKKYRIILTALNANMANFGLGICLGWTSPVMPKLRDHTEDSPLERGVTSSEEGWISSIYALAALLGSALAGPIVDMIGRKRTLLLASLLFIVSFVLLLTGREIWFIYVARVLQGIGGGAGATSLPMYIGEISTDDCRGALGSLMSIFIIGGILYAYCIGPYVSYMTLQWCCLVIPIINFVTFIFMPESPYYFAGKGRKMDGLKSLQFLRGQSSEAVEDEMMLIQKTVDDASSNKGTLLDIFRSRAYRKALFICCGLLSFQQLTGTTVVTLNSQSIFSSVNSPIDPAIATIILGLVQLVSNLLTPFFIDRAGRKVILLISATGMCLALFALGAFFYIQAFGVITDILWLPVPAMVFFNILYSFGFGSIPWAVLGEMFPSNIKSTATSMGASSCFVVGFLTTRWFPELNDLGPYYAFWMFASFCILAFFFAIFVMIETKGLSLQQIQEKLHN